MGARERYLEFLKMKGALPASYACGGKVKKYNQGGEVEPSLEEDDEEFFEDIPMTFEDKRYNYKFDTSGTPAKYQQYAHGGKVAGEYDKKEVERHMAQALKMRRFR